MPKRATRLVEWRPGAQAYVALQDGAPRADVSLDTPAWFAWLETVPSFSFQSASGDRLTVRKEAVQRGEYWYAYRRAQGRMVKRYLGRSADLTRARLETVAADLNDAPAAAPKIAFSAPDAPTTAPAGEFQLQAATASTPPPVVQPASPTLLLSTKTHVPRAPARLVTRPHVHQRLQRGLERPLTLIAAPAGFGKTTALRAWIQDAQVPVAWVSLDARDSDPLQFWTYLLTALETAHPGLATTALAMLQAPRTPPLATVVRTLLNALATRAQDVVLILDDYHLIMSPAVHESLALALEHPPAQLHLYLTTRREPPLPLARLRAYDQVNDIRVDDLRFRPDEVAAFLADVMGVSLSGEEMFTLAERTDGWIAGLQLAALSLQGAADPARFVATFGGSHRPVLHYLGEEVLATLPEDMQRFLLETSILERLCAPLCDVVTGRADGATMLERLDHANFFLVPLDDEGRWYRYYHLFADQLRHRLQQTTPTRVPELRRRAARWLEEAGWIIEAAQHYFAVPDAAEAARIIEQAAREMLKRGEIAPLLRLLAQLPEGVIASRLRLSLYQAEALFSRGQLEQAERLITSAEQALTATAPTTAAEALGDDERREALGAIAGGRAVLAAMRGDAQGALRYAQEARAALTSEDSPALGGVLLALGHAYRLNGEIRRAGELYREASRQSFAAGNLYTATIALNQEAFVAVMEGRLRRAADLCRQVIQAAEAQGGASRSLAAGAYSSLAQCLYEWNDLVEARLALEKTVALGEQWGNPADQVAGYAWQAVVYQAQGRLSAATEAIAQADSLLRTNVNFPWLPRQIAGLHVRLAIRQGRTDVQERWMRARAAEEAGDASAGPGYLHEFESLTLARLLLAQGAAAEAASLLEQTLRAAQAEERIGGVIETRSLLALALQAQGDSTQALASLAEALTLALPEGYVRLFVDEGISMRALLARLREQQPRGSVLRHYSETLLAAFDQTPGAPSARQPTWQRIEPLSDREREVLSLLAQGRSNQEIARHLVVAVSTVKTHLHHLFAKLQAADRLQAVTRARELGLLER